MTITDTHIPTRALDGELLDELRGLAGREMEVVGGSAIRSDHELSRLLRDSRAAAYHPASDALAHEAIGKAVLGIDSEGPRW